MQTIRRERGSFPRALILILSAWLGFVIFGGSANSQEPVATPAPALPGGRSSRVLVEIATSMDAVPDATDLPAQTPLPDAVLEEALRRAGATKLTRVFRSGGVPIRDAARFHELGLDRQFIVQLALGSSPTAAMEVLAACPSVLSSRQDALVRAHFVPNDPMYTQQWNLQQSNDKDIDASVAWNSTTGSSQTIVAVLDTGIDPSHQDLAGAVLSGYDFVNGDALAADDNGHGTACAGIIGARGNNGTGIAGIDWQCKLLPVKVLASDGHGWQSDTAAGVVFATNSGADIINMSLGAPGAGDVALVQALAYAAGLGVLCIASSGNHDLGLVWFPASDPNCMAVGASNKEDERKSKTSSDGDTSWGSNHGVALDLIAPGIAIRTTALGGGYLTDFWGTSAAAPHVSGVASLVHGLHPSFTLADLWTALTSTAQDQVGPAIEDLPGWDPFYGWGRLNAADAITYVPTASSTVIVSVNSAGLQSPSQSSGGTAGSFYPTGVSANGDFPVFIADASTLVPNDTNNRRDVFRHDLFTGHTLAASVTPAGNVANNGADDNCVAISANGGYVVFASGSTDIVAGDSNGYHDVFRRDMSTGSTIQVSVGPGGVQGNEWSGRRGVAVSFDGKYVVFDSLATNLNNPGYTPNIRRIFLRNCDANTNELISKSSSPLNVSANDECLYVAMTPDARYVAFTSRATNLVPGDTNGFMDVFVRDRQQGTTERVSISSSGAEGNSHSTRPAISSDGRYVAFESIATNLGPGASPAGGIYVRDRIAKVTSFVSIPFPGATGITWAAKPAMSGDGRLIAFTSDSPSIVAGKTNGWDDVFIVDLWSCESQIVSVALGGSQTNGPSGGVSLSADGTHVVFGSAASNLIPNDINGNVADVFERDIGFPPPGQSPWTDVGSALAGAFGEPELSGGGLPVPGGGVTLVLSNAAPNANTWLFIGLSASNLPLLGGVLVPAPNVVIAGVATDAAGQFVLASPWPNGIPAGLSMFFQAWIVDAAAVAGAAASNALQLDSK